MSEVAPLAIEVDATHGRLARRLTTFANLALTYSGVGAAVGIFALFGFSMSFSGPSMLWGWVITGVGVAIMCLLFAEMASHYPYAGVAYQWSAILSGRRIGWWVGWIYLFGVIWTLSSFYFTIQNSVVPLFGLKGSQGQLVGLALVTLIVATAFNAAGIEILGRFTKIGVILELGVFVGITALVLIGTPHHQSPSFLLTAAGTSHSASGWILQMLGGGMFLAIWVMFSFENGGTLGEETIDAHRKAPKAILGAFLVTFLAGLAFIAAIFVSAPDRAKLLASGSPVTYVVGSALGDAGTKIFLILIACITLLGGNAFFAGAVRHLFAMARDDQLPFARQLSKVRQSTGAPYVAVFAIAVITVVPFIQSQTLAVLAIGSTTVMYVAYFLIMLVLLAARLRGWPQVDSPFRLGRFGMPLNVVAVLFAGAIMINGLWPRAATNPDKWGLPVAWWLLGVPLIIGAIYFAAVLLPRYKRAELASHEAAQSTAETNANG
jgi:amino acid transporter